MLVSSHLTPGSFWRMFRIPSSAEQTLKVNKAVVFIHLDSSTEKSGLQKPKLFLFNIFQNIFLHLSHDSAMQL